MARRLMPPAAARVVASSRAPVIALVLILGFSFAARVLHINAPCQSPCKKAAQHTLIFDEAFYVNAARAIARVHQPSNSPYAGSPAGKDPNAEHPQLAKLVIAGGIEVFGDSAWGWRIGSVLFSLIAMIALYALVTGVGGSRWLAVGTVGVMALDNLALVHGRIATLDIYVLALMLVAAALYVRNRAALAGLALGVGACMKVVALYLLVALVLYELARAVLARGQSGSHLRAARDAAKPVVYCAAATAVAFFGLLWVLDLLFPAWDPGSHTTYAGNPFSHFGHMVKFAELLKANSKHPGISSTPLQWLIDRRPIHYATTAVTVTKSAAGHVVSRQVTTTIDFLGEINPFVIFLAVPSLILALAFAWRFGDRVALLGVSWTLGTYAPFLVQSEILHRTSYLFYMLIVMPGIYVMTARVLSPRYAPKIAVFVWAGLLVYGFVHLYPLRTVL